MCDFWNQKRNPPARCTLPYTAEEQRDDNMIKSLQTVVEILNSLQKLESAYKALEVERNILAKTLYRSNNQFRHEKRQRFMKMINKSLERHININVLKEVSSLQECFPGPEVSEFHPMFSSDVYIPSRQMYEHLLVECLVSTALLSRCQGLSMATFKMVRQMLMLSHFIPNMAVLSAILARIWVLCRYLVTKQNEIYMKLRRVLPNIKAVATPWVPEHCSLPVDLSQFMEKSARPESTAEIQKVAENAAALNAQSSGNKDSEDNGIPERSYLEDLGIPVRRDTEDLGIPVRRDAEDLGIPVRRDTEDLGIPIRRDTEDLGIPVRRDIKRKREAGEEEETSKKATSSNDLNTTKEPSELDIGSLVKKRRVTKKKKKKSTSTLLTTTNSDGNSMTSGFDTGSENKKRKKNKNKNKNKPVAS